MALTLRGIGLVAAGICMGYIASSVPRQQVETRNEVECPLEPFQLLRKHIGELLDKGQKEPEERVIPVYGAMCTDIDLELLKGQLLALDVGVKAFFIVANGVSEPEMLNFLLQAAEEFGPDRFYYIHNEDNVGVAPVWNAMLDYSFDKNNHSWVMIANADLHPRQGQLAPWLDWVYGNRTVDSCGIVFFARSWAMFGVTRTGYRKLGMFDENHWPAYGEDIEYLVRSMAAKVPRCNPPWKTDYVHVHGANRKKNNDLTKLVSRFKHGKEYLAFKWGVHIWSRPTPYAGLFDYPWQNEKINYGTWVLDPNLRKCIQTGKGYKVKDLCTYDLKAMMPKILQNKRPGAWVYSLQPRNKNSTRSP